MDESEDQTPDFVLAMINDLRRSINYAEPKVYLPHENWSCPSPGWMEKWIAARQQSRIVALGTRWKSLKRSAFNDNCAMSHCGWSAQLKNQNNNLWSNFLNYALLTRGAWRVLRHWEETCWESKIDWYWTKNVGSRWELPQSTACLWT